MTRISKHHGETDLCRTNSSLAWFQGFAAKGLYLQVFSILRSSEGEVQQQHLTSCSWLT